MPKKKIDDIGFLECIDKGLISKEIARVLTITPSAVSQKIKRLREKKIIEISPFDTFDKRILKLGNYKVYRLTERGKLILRGGDAHPLINLLNFDKKRPRKITITKIDDFSIHVKHDSVVEGHGICYMIRIIGNHGILPPHLRHHRMQNWVKHHGKFMGGYICFTTKNIFVFLGAKGKDSEEVDRKVEEQLEGIWDCLHFELGWDIDREIIPFNHTTGAKYSALWVHRYDELDSPQEGIFARVDDTPIGNTIHGKGFLEERKMVVDDAVIASHWVKENGDLIVTEDKLEMAINRIENIIRDVMGKRKGDDKDGGDPAYG